MKILYSDRIADCQQYFDLAHNYGRVTKRTIDAEECNDLLQWAVDGHLRKCPKRRLVGTVAKIHACTDHMPRSYKFAAMNTVAEYRHNGRGWVLVDVRREPVKAFNGHIEFELSQDAKEYILTSLQRV